MPGYTLWDKKRSTDVREQLGIFNTNDKLMQYKINCRENVQRMHDNRLTPWLMEPGGSMPHSQGLPNNSHPEPNQPNYPH